MIYDVQKLTAVNHVFISMFQKEKSQCFVSLLRFLVIDLGFWNVSSLAGKVLELVDLVEWSTSRLWDESLRGLRLFILLDMLMGRGREFVGFNRSLLGF